MKKTDFLQPAPENFIWPQCPEADQFVRDRIDYFLTGHIFANQLSQRMKNETGTEFQSWVDHLILPKKIFSEAHLKKLGFIRDLAAKAPVGVTAYWHPFADLPRLLLSASSIPSCAIMVESISDFQLAHKLSLPLKGKPLSLYREASLMAERTELKIIERRGTRSYRPDDKERAAKYLEAVDLWLNRQREFHTNSAGMNHAWSIAKKMVSSVGTGMAACAFLEAERRFWQSRNRTAQLQKARQDVLGLGWANHDHHTFRSSRPAFPMLMKIFQTFGFKKRERYYAGEEAGWGAQIVEQPDARLIIFADVDLTPNETSVDFASVPLPELNRPGTIGLWCALHGESVLQAGMHHLEGKFNFDGLQDGLKNIGVNFMKPFSDFPHLRQAFSEGELWLVAPRRLDALFSANRISKDAYDRIKQNGAVGSHLENLQRRNGFKGFNQRGVSAIIREVNPELQAMKGSKGAA